MNIFRLSFPLQMAISTLLGIFFGLFLGERCSVLAPWASAYIMILKVTAIPYLTVAIIHGIGLLNPGQARQILKKGSFFITLALCINIGIIYLIKQSFPAVHDHHAIGYAPKEIPPINFAKILIPENIFHALANNIIPAVVVFSLLIGIALMYLADKQTAMAGLKTLLEALTKVTSWIGRITPLGTFLVMANQVGTVQFATIKQIGTYLILFALGTSIVIFWIGPRLASMLTPMKAYTWLKNLIPVLVLAYTTNLVIVALPYIIDIVQRETQMLYPKDENVQNQIQGTVSIIFNLPLGSIFLTAFIFFTSVFYSVPLSLHAQLKLFLTTFLTSLGSVGIGSSINSLTFLLDTLALPTSDAVNLFLTAVPFTAGFQSMVSAMLISTLSFLITLAGRGLLVLKWKKIVLGTVFTFLPVLLIFTAVKMYAPLPQIKNTTKSIYELDIESDVQVKVFTKAESNQISPASYESTLNHIFQTKKLRVGYNPSATPFCFFNKHQKLVGFDVAYAYELAYDLGAEQIEFIPLTYSKVGEELSSQAYDIAMSAISISTESLKKMYFPSPILEAKIVFVALDKNRKKFSSLETVQADRSLKIAALVNTAYEGLAYELFPYHQVVLIENYQEFSSERPIADVLIWEEQEAIAWTASHPPFHVIYPDPNLGKNTLGYPVKFGDQEFLAYLNSWLTLKENSGFKTQQYHLWILGQTQKASPPQPRWSIFDNVLHLGK